MIVLWIVLGVIYLIIQIKILWELANVAEEKGYEKKQSFWYLLLGGLPACLLVVAMPDLNLRALLRDAQKDNSKADTAFKNFPGLRNSNN